MTGISGVVPNKNVSVSISEDIHSAWIDLALTGVLVLTIKASS